jgi:phosphoglycerate dehydrogenase-like enzyme
MKANVVVTSSSICANEAARKMIQHTLSGLCNIVFCSSKYPGQDLAGLTEEADYDYDYALIGRERVSTHTLLSMPKLKGISVYGVGIDNVDLPACLAQKIPVHVARGVNAPWVAEHVVGMAISLLRKLSFNHYKLSHQGCWNKDGGKSLRGKLVGIVGYGAVGVQVAHLAKAFGCEILVNDVVHKETEVALVGGRQVDLSTLLSESDVVSLHVPLDRSTRGLLKKQNLMSMKTTSILINTCRGGVVSEPDLITALKNRSILGAALDVFEEEPNIDNDFKPLDNVLLTPHTAGNCQEAIKAMTLGAIQGIDAWLKS